MIRWCSNDGICSWQLFKLSMCDFVFQQPLDDLQNRKCTFMVWIIWHIIWALCVIYGRNCIHIIYKSWNQSMLPSWYVWCWHVIVQTLHQLIISWVHNFETTTPIHVSMRMDIVSSHCRELSSWNSMMMLRC